MDENPDSQSAPACHSCHQPNPPGANFCQNCGSRLQQICADCGTAISADAKFCHQCGKPTEIADDRRETIRAYTPKHLADKILTSRSALEGERKQVTVLFADVKGSMELAQQIDAEDWHTLLDEFFRILAGGIHRFEGTVNQYTGDGIMALFGAPIAHEDHALRACNAALYLRDELRRHADQLRLKRGLNFGVRIGLNSGEVVVGRIGDDLRMDYTAQGQTVGLAARMEQLAETGCVYITEYTNRFVEGFFKVRDLGMSSVKGIRRPLRIYELEGLGHYQSRLDLSRGRGFSRFIGRSDEMTILQAELQQTEKGRGGVVCVVGDPGVGKSRLCHEFLKIIHPSKITICSANCASHNQTVPFFPVLQLVRDLLDLSEHDSADEARKKIAGTLILLDEGFKDSLPIWFDFLTVADPRRPSIREDSDEHQRKLFALILRLVQLMSRHQPLIILIDDLHWIDLPSDAFIARLVDSVKDSPVLVLLNFRPEYRRIWMNRSICRTLPLAALDNDGARELLDNLLGNDPSVKDLARRLVARALGNPFFIEELVRELVDAGNLAGQPGAYRLVKPVKTNTLPHTVQALLAARIDRLGETPKQTLQAASVIGQEFEESILRQASGLLGAKFEEGLYALNEVEFIYQKAFYPTAVYAFRHPIVMEVAYRSLLSKPRIKLHHRTALALEAVHPGRRDELAGMLAHHWEKADEPHKAAGWHRRAAQVGGFAEIQKTFYHWVQVLKLAQMTPATDEARRLQLEACCGALDIGGRVDISLRQAGEIFEQGRQLAEYFDDHSALLRLHEEMAARLGWSGDFAGQRQYLREATIFADKVAEPAVKLGLLQRRYVAEFHQGDLRSALALVDEGIAGCQTDQAALPQPVFVRLLRSFLLARANVLSMMGQLKQAQHLIDQAAHLMRSTDAAKQDSRTTHTEALIRANLSIYIGNFDDCMRDARAFMELVHRSGSTWAMAVSASALGRAHLIGQRWLEAREALNTALTQARQHQLGLEAEASYLALLAEATAGCGEVEKAVAIAGEAVAVAGRKETHFWELQAQLSLAGVLSLRNRANDRRRIGMALERAEALIEKTGGEVMRPHMLERRAMFAKLTGNDVDCHGLLQEAHRKFTSMGAHGHANRLAGKVS